VPETVASEGEMDRDAAEAIISRVTARLLSFKHVRGIALTGSRGRGEGVDEYSAADFLVCVAEDGTEEMTKGAWLGEIGEPELVFPPVVPRGIRVFYSGFFDCDFHFYTPAELEDAKGECGLGTYVAAGFRILHDPAGILGAMSSRVRPEPDELDEGPFELNASAFWFNMAWCAKQIRRGDLFRAYRFTNWWLQQFLLGMIERYTPVPGDKDKRVAARLNPDHYRRLAETLGPLDRESMIAGLKKCAECFWVVQREFAPDLNRELLQRYRNVERFVVGRES